jgi:hypothetical protein
MSFESWIIKIREILLAPVTSDGMGSDGAPCCEVSVKTADSQEWVTFVLGVLNTIKKNLELL